MLTLSITKNGQYYINKREILSEELAAKCLPSPKPIRIRRLSQGRCQCPYERVAQLMAACTQAGITKIEW